MLGRTASGDLTYIGNQERHKMVVQMTNIKSIVTRLVSAWALVLKEEHCTRCQHLPFILIIAQSTCSIAYIVAAQQLKLHCVLLASSRKETTTASLLQETGACGVWEPTTVEPKTMDFTPYTLNYEPCIWHNSPLLHNGSVTLLTSGSTGTPKIVVSSWTALIIQGECSVSLLKGTTFRWICSSSIAHAYAINAIFAALASSPTSTIYLTSSSSLLDLLQTPFDGTTVVYATPGTFVQWKEARVTRPLFADIVFCAGSPLPETLSDLLLGFGITVRQNYGSTECGSIAAQYELDVDHVVGSVDTLWPGVKINEIKTSLSFTTPWQGVGYLRKQTLHIFQNGHETGDVGVISNTQLHLTSRIRRTIWIHQKWCLDPQEIEKALERNVQVMKAVVIQDEPTSPVHAFLIMISGKHSTEYELLEWCRLHLEAKHCPNQVHFTPYFHCSPAGKIIFSTTYQLEQSTEG